MSQFSAGMIIVLALIAVLAAAAVLGHRGASLWDALFVGAVTAFLVVFVRALRSQAAASIARGARREFEHWVRPSEG